MKFEKVLSSLKTFFKNDGIVDHVYEMEKPRMMQVVQSLHALLLQGLSPAERNEIRCAQEIRVPEDCPARRSLQQLHFFIKELRLEKAVWSNVFRFINFPLQSTVPRYLRWMEPKELTKVKKKQLITSYADSLLYLLREKEHLILPKIEQIEVITKKQQELRLQIKQFEYVIEHMHKEYFCAKHYHFIRPWMTRQQVTRDSIKLDSV